MARRDPAADALHRLYVAQANYDAALTAKARTRELLDKAIAKAYMAGLSKAEIGRAVGSSPQRIGQIVAEFDTF